MPIITRPKEGDDRKDCAESKEILCDKDDDRKDCAESKELYNCLTEIPTGYQFNPQNLNTLENELLNNITNESKRRQNDLHEAFSVLHLSTKDKAKSKELFDKIVWPTWENSRIDVRFGNELGPAMGTGFYIGGNMVVTAGHVAEDEDMTSHYVVFDFMDRVSGEGLTARTVFKKTQVFRLKRVILNNTGTTERPLVPGESKLDAEERRTLSYDFVVLEIQGLVQEPDKLLPKLIIDLIPPLKDTPVFTIGSPSGLSFKYSGGGTIQNIPDCHLPPDLQGTLTADLSIFRGNSGGPLFSAKIDYVCGVVRSGALWPYRDQGTKSDLKDSIERWVKYQKDFMTEDKWQEKDEELIKYKWFNSAENLCTYDELSLRAENMLWKASWFHLTADDEIVRRLNRFTRLDPLGYFTQPLSHFFKIGGFGEKFDEKFEEDRPTGHITITLTVDMHVVGPAEKSTVSAPELTLIHSGGQLCNIDNASVDRQAFSMANITWLLSSINTEQEKIKVDSFQPRDVCDFSLCEWESVVLTHKSSNGSRMVPIEDNGKGESPGGKISATFKREAGKTLTTEVEWGTSDFTFEADLRFAKDKTADEWTAHQW